MCSRSLSPSDQTACWRSAVTSASCSHLWRAWSPRPWALIIHSSLDQYRTMGVPENVTLLAGQWPEVKPEGQFDRILVYSVIQYVLDARSAIAFLDACLASLRPGGRLLLGDLPNRDAKARFLSSPAGQSFNASWNDRKALSSPEDEIIVSCFESLTIDPIACFDDEFLLRLLRDTRQKGFESYLLPQPAVLPFGNTPKMS